MNKSLLTYKHLKSRLFFTMFFLGLFVFANSNAQDSTAVASATAVAAAPSSAQSVLSSPLFWVFIASIIALLVVIVTMGSVLIGLVNTKLRSNTTKVITLLILCISFGTASAQTTAATPVQALVGGLEPSTIIVLTLAVAIELFVIIYMYNILQRLMVSLGYAEARESKWTLKYWYKQMTKSIPLERESEVETDHDYDGIRELDNNLPPWWVYMFYVTIVFGIVYLIYFNFASGPSQLDEYNKELEVASIQKTEMLKKAASNVDETTVIALLDPADLAKGKSSFITKCAACHGQLGEGGVGPNLTDDYWIHGGSISSIFKTIKYGVQEKGMIAWQAQIQPLEMQQLSSYILTLKGTNPPNGKAPQGTIYVDTVAAAPATTDSLASATNDTTVLSLK
jgi:cytochrome c oxidase cbb3-type subunit III